MRFLKVLCRGGCSTATERTPLDIFENLTLNPLLRIPWKRFFAWSHKSAHQICRANHQLTGDMKDFLDYSLDKHFSGELLLLFKNQPVSSMFECAVCFTTRTQRILLQQRRGLDGPKCLCYRVGKILLLCHIISDGKIWPPKWCSAFVGQQWLWTQMMNACHMVINTLRANICTQDCCVDSAYSLEDFGFLDLPYPKLAVAWGDNPLPESRCGRHACHFPDTQEKLQSICFLPQHF